MQKAVATRRGCFAGGRRAGAGVVTTSRSNAVRHSQARAVAANSSMFEGVEQAPADPILGVTTAFRADEDERKLNLGVGAYRDDNLQPVVLSVVRKADERVLAQKNPTGCSPVDGLAPLTSVGAELMFGAV